MKKLVIALHLMVAVSLAQADTQTHPYRAEVSGPAGCVMPANPAKPVEGECAVKMGVFETGSKIVKTNGVCMETVTELVALRKIKFDGQEIDAPELQTQTKMVKCPS